MWRKPTIRHAAFAAAALSLTLVGISYSRAVFAPNSPGWTLRSAEWVRDNRLGWALDFGESVWYSVFKPTAADLQEMQLRPAPQPFPRQRNGPKISLQEPASLRVLFGRPLEDEGKWRAIGSTVNGIPALRSTLFRPDPGQPSVAVGVARFTPELTRFVLVPGARDQKGSWSWRGGIPEDQRDSLLAAFNSGFKLRDARGGLYTEGKYARPLVPGAASLVIDKDGSADVIAWPKELAPTDRFDSVRQNLRLIVSGGKVKVRKRRRDSLLWRTGVGVAADGALLYAGGVGLDMYTLAKALKQAGAVRAMQLDIHRAWQCFNTFQPTNANSPQLVGTTLLFSMRCPNTQFLNPHDRDFFAAFVR